MWRTYNWNTKESRIDSVALRMLLLFLSSSLPSSFSTKISKTDAYSIVLNLLENKTLLFCFSWILFKTHTKLIYFWAICEEVEHSFINKLTDKYTVCVQWPNRCQSYWIIYPGQFLYWRRKKIEFVACVTRLLLSK